MSLPFGETIPFGLINSMGICHFNSVIQAVLGGYYFTRHCVSKDYKAIMKNDEEKKDDNINPELQKVFSAMVNDVLHGGIPAFMGMEILKLIGKKSPASNYATGFETASEGLRHLINQLHVEELFTLKYDIKRICGECGNEVIRQQEKSDNNIFVTMFDIDVDVDRNKTFAETMVERIKSTRSDLPDYKCPKCGKKSTTYEERKLKFISEYIIVIFNKYEGVNITIGKPPCAKHDLKPPLKLEFKTKAGEPRIFNAIALIEHPGGHYYTLTKRGDRYFFCSDGTINEIPRLETDENTYVVIYEVE